jgi:hypothetical protein
MGKSARIGFLTSALLPIFLGSLLALSACNNQTEEANNDPPTTESSPTETTGGTESPGTETTGTQTTGNTPITVGLENSDRPNTDPLAILQSDQMKKELGLTDDQVSQLKTVQTELQATMKEKTSGVDFKELAKDDAKLKAFYADLDKDIQASREKVNGILKPEQVKRVREISLQLYGFGVLTLADVSQDLKITPEQQTKMDTLRKDLVTKMKAAWEVPSGSAQEQQQVIANNRKKMDQILEENNQQALAVLTDEQKKTLETLKGEKFDLDLSALTPAGAQAQ